MRSKLYTNVNHNLLNHSSIIELLHQNNQNPSKTRKQKPTHYQLTYSFYKTIKDPTIFCFYSLFDSNHKSQKPNPSLEQLQVSLTTTQDQSQPASPLEPPYTTTFPPLFLFHCQHSKLLHMMGVSVPSHSHLEGECSSIRIDLDTKIKQKGVICKYVRKLVSSSFLTPSFLFKLLYSHHFFSMKLSPN